MEVDLFVRVGADPKNEPHGADVQVGLVPVRGTRAVGSNSEHPMAQAAHLPPDFGPDQHINGERSKR